ncbi:hypothetical protein JOM49_002346 [Amycolatopsis magusensis]|uniref:Uncharacterized protein n=1 Tax=Amycolatopsis magusensis TaxID=882444 RepID=A0ABS4PN45_9PSEU|nr:hypothetical protein [Amycolatopsis magusensis]
MVRLLTNLKFWALALSLTWLLVVIAIIAKNPDFAHGAQ